MADKDSDKEKNSKKAFDESSKAAEPSAAADDSKPKADGSFNGAAQDDNGIKILAGGNPKATPQSNTGPNAQAHANAAPPLTKPGTKTPKAGPQPNPAPNPQGHPNAAAPPGANPGPQKKRYRDSAWKKMMLSISDYDDYLIIKGQGAPMTQTRKALTEDQIAHALMNLVLKKGFTTIHCYSGHKPDSTLASQVNHVFAKLRAPGGPLEGVPVQITSDPMQDPPFLGTIGKRQHKRHLDKEAATHAKAVAKINNESNKYVT